MANLVLKSVNKVYPNNIQAVFDFNIDIKDGEFIVFVGPSGCGKSTTLRMIAGLEEISSGEMYLDGVKINDKAPADRDITMVFQNYALYGNMSVYDNIGFSLIIRKESQDAIYEKVIETAEVVELSDYLTRFPGQLSGGQRQRVALGRSIARKAKVFLMDEPLSNLDAKLRAQSRREILALHKKLNATIVYVTHDQIEAMTMASRIVVMKDGYIQQIDTPQNIYSEPVNTFVAGFIGSNPMNFIKGKMLNGIFIAQSFSFELFEEQKKLLSSYENKEIILGVRPEHVSVSRKEGEGIVAEIISSELLGYQEIIQATVGENTLTAVVVAEKKYAIHEKIALIPDKNKLHFFDIDTTNRIRT